MKPFQERVVTEKTELDERIAKLTTFVNSSQFFQVPVEERARLLLQKDAMARYSRILGERIGAFT